MKGAVSPACLFPAKLFPLFPPPSHTEQLYLSLHGMQWGRRFTQRDSPAAPRHTYSLPVPPSRLRLSWQQGEKNPQKTTEKGLLTQRGFLDWFGVGLEGVAATSPSSNDHSNIPRAPWNRGAVKTRGRETLWSRHQFQHLLAQRCFMYCGVTY